MTCIEELKKPLTIRGRSVANRMWLAPMAGLGHIAYRDVVAGFGGYGLLFTGMCSARAVPSENPACSPVFSWRTEELDTLVCQIFGAEPQDMARAAKRIEREGFFGVDINMGCSVSAIVNKRCGADLMRDIPRARAIVEAVRDAVDIPVFVKFRTGWEQQAEPAVRFAAMLEEAGADALVFHPRVAPDRRTKPPRIDDVRLVKQAVSLPVFGNGSISLPEDARHMLDRTGCDGISLGRIGIARPWIFAEWMKGFVPTEATYKETLFTMLDALESRFEPTRAIKLYKKFVMYYAANFTFGNALFGKLIKGNTMEAMRDNAERELQNVPQFSKRPNSLMFTM